jgi:hypothetical protein
MSPKTNNPTRRKISITIEVEVTAWNDVSGLSETELGERVYAAVINERNDLAAAAHIVALDIMNGEVNSPEHHLTENLTESFVDLSGDPSNEIPLVVGVVVEGCWTVPETRMWREDEILSAVANARKTER